MSFKEVSKAVQAIREARKEHGILSVRGNEVHLSNEVFESLLCESRVKPIIASRESKDFPYEVAFINENVIYYSLYTSERMEEKIKGIPNGRKLHVNWQSS
ncbi:hypothetical protein [Bacillus pseudomycoides]|uniref:hypothetical protein n=1 Tax=Bacillus pseudomycoides TaxID=64104 RepID=UPI000BF378D9|nr:hypothetical protein [Bacillus pseudomycoides]PFW97677.1 hypothetical protein COL29_02530 [Bacillus pseudomycoides]